MNTFDNETKITIVYNMYVNATYITFTVVLVTWDILFSSCTVYNTILLFIHGMHVCMNVSVSVTGASDEVRAEAGAPVSLPCRVDTAQCGELHSVKWYRDNHRVFVFSHVANIRRPEGDGSDRLVLVLYALLLCLLQLPPLARARRYPEYQPKGPSPQGLNARFSRSI